MRGRERQRRKDRMREYMESPSRAVPAGGIRGVPSGGTGQGAVPDSGSTPEKKPARRNWLPLIISLVILVLCLSVYIYTELERTGRGCGCAKNLCWTRQGAELDCFTWWMRNLSYIMSCGGAADPVEPAELAVHRDQSRRASGLSGNRDSDLTEIAQPLSTEAENCLELLSAGAAGAVGSEVKPDQSRMPDRAALERVSTDPVVEIRSSSPNRDQRRAARQARREARRAGARQD